MTGLFRERCPCGRSGIRPGGAPCADYPRCVVEDIIAGRQGRERAVSLAQLRSMTGLGDREIKRHVHDLRMEGVRIGSVRMPDGPCAAGYFMIVTLGELRDFLRGYGRQALSELKLIQCLLGKDYRMVKELEGQLALDLGEEAVL